MLEGESKNSRATTIVTRVDSDNPSLGGDGPEQRAEGHWCINTLSDNAPLSQVIERLNDLMLVCAFIFDGGAIDRNTLAMVREKTQFMRGAYVKPKPAAQAEALPLGAHPDEKGAVNWLQTRLRGWQPGTTYPCLARITDEMAAAGFADRHKRRYSQRQVQSLSQMGRRPFEGQWS